MSIQTKGIILAVISAICYGMNPLGALYLYEEGLNVSSVTFYRFLFATFILGFFMLIFKKSFFISKKELYILAFIGLLFGISALSLFSSFLYMDAGVASTILFIYPIFVAVIMALFFKESISIITILSVLLAFFGVVLLYGAGEKNLNFFGVFLVFTSSLCYAVYIVIVNQTLKIPALKLTFYSMVFCTLTIFIYSLFDEKYAIMQLANFNMWFFTLFLAIIPTVISLLFLVKAVKMIGSTPASILGALEPLTAVGIGVLVFAEKLTTLLVFGIILILFAVILIISKDLIEKIFHLKG